MNPDLRATYRVQVTPQVPLDAVTAAVPYLHRLGVSHVYTSPLLQAAPGSQHGYDVIDHSLVNVELGGAAALERLHHALAEHGMGHVLDIVPNHMAVGDPANPWWWDVLERGPESRYAEHFDINWDPETPSLLDRVLVPVLGVRYGEALAEGHITVERAEDRFVIRYFDHLFPVRPSTYRLAVAALDGSPSRLHDLLEHQHYRLAWWRTASDEIDYRRFFDITTLAGLRIEDAEVFRAVHELALQWVAAGKVHGLRVDHPDGLRNPRLYFEQLAEAAPGAWVVAEKILEHGETLRQSWAIAGTTGYEFATDVTGVLIDTDAQRAFDELHERYVPGLGSLDDVVLEAKRELIDTAFGAEIDRLASSLVRMAQYSLELRDLPRSTLRTAVAELLAAMPVYRTYIELPEYRPGVIDLEYLEEAGRLACERGVAEPYAVEALCAVLRGDIRVRGSANFVARFQQTSGPVMAKGIEDTAMYRYVRLLALNEVGSDPATFGRSIDQFHAANEHRAAEWPTTMLTTSTHDTKRSEDVRARLAVLSEVPARWAQFMSGWSELVEPHRSGAGGDVFPDTATMYFLAQTLVGAWPIALDRLVPYLEKAMREAKLHTSWTDQNPGYERAVFDFAAAVLTDPKSVGAIEEFVAEIDGAGQVNALTMALLKLTSPGVPDIYQGCEVWTDALVDPDNRRPIDYAALAAVLDRLAEGIASGLTPAAAAALSDPGATKMAVTYEALAVRREFPHCFAPPDGDYERIEAGRFVVAYQRGRDVIVAVPVLSRRRDEEGGWGDQTVELPPGTWRNRFTAESWRGVVPVSSLLGGFPVALFVRETQ